MIDWELKTPLLNGTVAEGGDRERHQGFGGPPERGLNGAGTQRERGG